LPNKFVTFRTDRYEVFAHHVDDKVFATHIFPLFAGLI
jgi:hypothetical protein